MTITRVSSATGTNSLTMPTHAAGDLLLMFAYRDGSTTAPGLPAGWTDLNNGGTATNSCRIAYKIAASGSEVSGTWTNATSLICVVYRSDGIIGVGGVARSSAASTTVSYPALTMVNADGTSWVAGFAGHRSVNTSVETPPTGMTNITSVLDATDEAAAHDTNGPVSSWSLQTVSVGGTSSGWIGATVEITDEPLPVPPSGDNPCTIMASASEVDLFFDAAASDLFEDTAGTTAATTDGDPVNYIASLWGADFVAGASSGRNAVLRLPGGEDPYLEAVPGSSQLRASIARSGDLYVICRGRWNGTANDTETFWFLTNNASQFYTGNFMTPKYFPFGFNYIQTESSIGFAVTTAAVAITRGVWSTLEIWVDGSTIYTAVDGGTPETYAASGPLGDTTLMDIFGSLDGGVTGSFAVDIRRLAVLNALPDSTERTNLLDWAENGDAGGGGTVEDGSGTSAGVSSASGVGRSSSGAEGGASGSATGSGVGAATGAAVGTPAGSSTALGVGASEARSGGLASGSSGSVGEASSEAGSSGVSGGSSEASGTGAKAISSGGFSEGSSVAEALGGFLSGSLGSSNGSSGVLGVGRSRSEASGAGQGEASVEGSGGSVSQSEGVVNSAGISAGAGQSSARSEGLAEGTSTAFASSSSGGPASTDGISQGASTASAQGRSSSRALGSSNGGAESSGSGRVFKRAVAEVLGSSQGQAVGRSSAWSEGLAEGTSTASGVETPELPEGGTLEVPGSWRSPWVARTFEWGPRVASRTWNQPRVAAAEWRSA